MKIDRLFGIVYLLLERKTMTAAQLAEHFGVSKRTILRDIDTLSLSGIPLYATKGRGGGISLIDGFVMSRATFTSDEQSQLLIALQGLRATQQLDTDAIVSKLAGLFNQTEAPWIEVDFSRWGSADVDTQKFELLKTAIVSKRVVELSYVDSLGETTQRRVYPLKLIFKSHEWYLQAYCCQKNDYRTFKVKRIFQVEQADACFEREDFRAPLLEEPSSSQEHLVSLQLVFKAEVAHRVYEEFSPHTIKNGDKGTLIVETKMPHDAWLYGFLLSFGSAVCIEAPCVVREGILKQVEEIKKIYEFF